MNTNTKYLIWPIAAAPLVYLAIVWNKLADRVPMHYNLKGEIDRYGNKSELLGVMLVMSAVSVGIYFLLANIHRIDPKKKYSSENLPRMRRLGFLLGIFFSALGFLIVYSCLHVGLKFQSKFVVIGIGLLFAVIGNYIYNIKPNYFAGIRTPWALENEENWKLTHKLGGKLWFAGGIVLAIAALLLPDQVSLILMIVVIAILAIIPIAYSYRLYARGKKMTGNNN